MREPNEMSLFFLSDVSLADASLVGSKAATLGELKRHGVNVPAGLCVSTTTFRLFLDLLHLPDPTTSQFFEKARVAILGASLPPDLASWIEKGLSTLIPNRSRLFCVRSSASVEDRPDYSFAGQFHSSIGVKSLPECLDAIKQCWASLFQEHVLHYLVGTGLSLSSAAMGVFIQPLVPAVKSGVLFTRNPVDGRNDFVIEATWGLGPPLVGGSVTPDYFRVTRSGELVEQHLGSKKLALSLAGTDLTEVVTPEDQRATATLTDDELHTLWQTAQVIEQVLGADQDIEFAWDENSLWILQARPITGVSAEPREDRAS